MQTFYCSNCGAAVESNLKFCRRCGHAVNLSEATTRTLDPPSTIEQSTQHINSMPTGPSYLPPEAMQPSPAPPTRGFEKGGPNRTVIILVSLVGFLLIALVVLGAISFYITRNSVSEPDEIPPPPPRASAPAPPGVPQPPSVVITPRPPVPPTPPTTPPTSTTGKSTISREMIYPGAQVNMEVNSPESGTVLQLRSTDPFEKVVAWYTAKIKPTKAVNTVGPTAILRGGGFNVVITGGDKGVNIILKEQ